MFACDQNQEYHKKKHCLITCQNKCGIAKNAKAFLRTGPEVALCYKITFLKETVTLKSKPAVLNVSMILRLNCSKFVLKLSGLNQIEK